MKFWESTLNRISTLLWEPIFDLGLQKNLAAKFQNLPGKIWLIYEPKSIKFGTNAQIWAYGFWLITQSFFVQFR